MRQTTLTSNCKWAVMGMALSFLFAGIALAHHGWGDYDAQQTLTLTGKILEASYENPHGSARLQVGGDQGKIWLAILAPPARMQARGLQRDALKPGVTATIVGYPHRNQAEEMRAERITIDGKTTELR